MQGYNYYMLIKDDVFDGFGVQILKDEPIKVDGVITGYKKIPADELPKGAIIITAAEHKEYLTALNTQLKVIKLDKGKIVISDIYTPEELATREAEAAKLKLISEAKTLLRMTDRFETHPYSNMMTEAERIMFREWRLEVLEVSIGVISIMPETPEFIKKLLEL